MLARAFGCGAGICGMGWDGMDLWVLRLVVEVEVEVDWWELGNAGNEGRQGREKQRLHRPRFESSIEREIVVT